MFGRVFGHFLDFKNIIVENEYIKQLSKNYSVLQEGKKIKHSFTHYKLDIDLLHLRVHGGIQNLDNKKVWFNNDDLTKVGLPSPVTRELEQIKKNESYSFL